MSEIKFTKVKLANRKGYKITRTDDGAIFTVTPSHVKERGAWYIENSLTFEGAWAATLASAACDIENRQSKVTGWQPKAVAA